MLVLAEIVLYVLACGLAVWLLDLGSPWWHFMPVFAWIGFALVLLLTPLDTGYPWLWFWLPFIVGLCFAAVSLILWLLAERNSLIGVVKVFGLYLAIVAALVTGFCLLTSLDNDTPGRKTGPELWDTWRGCLRLDNMHNRSTAREASLVRQQAGVPRNTAAYNSLSERIAQADAWRTFVNQYIVSADANSSVIREPCAPQRMAPTIAVTGTHGLWAEFSVTQVPNGDSIEWFLDDSDSADPVVQGRAVPNGQIIHDIRHFFYRYNIPGRHCPYVAYTDDWDRSGESLTQCFRL